MSDGVLPRITSQRVWLARSLALIAIALAEWNREKTLDSPIQVTVQPPHSPVVTGDTIRVSIRLADAGAGGAYQLAVRGLAEEWYTLEQPSVVLGPGEWATVSLAIRPPAALGRHTGSYTVTIEARAGDGAQGSAAFPLSVAPLQGIGLDITQVQATGATMALEASIVNAQEWDTMVGVVVSGPPEITALVDPAGYCLAPRGGTRRFVVHVGAAGARAGAGAYDLTVSAMVQGLSVAPSVTRRVRFEYRPYVVQRVLHPFVALATRRGFTRASIAALLALGLGLVAADTVVFRPSSPIAAVVPFTTSPPPDSDRSGAHLISGRPPRGSRGRSATTHRTFPGARQCVRNGGHVVVSPRRADGPPRWDERPRDRGANTRPSRIAHRDAASEWRRRHGHTPPAPRGPVAARRRGGAADSDSVASRFRGPSRWNKSDHYRATARHGNIDAIRDRHHCAARDPSNSAKRSPSTRGLPCLSIVTARRGAGHG